VAALWDFTPVWWRCGGGFGDFLFSFFYDGHLKLFAGKERFPFTLGPFILGPFKTEARHGFIYDPKKCKSEAFSGRAKRFFVKRWL
jgi:hypothetical protein